MAHTRIKRIKSHAGLARFLATCSEPIGWIPRDTDIKTPYSSGPTHVAYSALAPYDRNLFFIAETAHRTYDVFECTNDTIYKTDEIATEVFINSKKVGE